MPTINQLPLLTQISADDQIPVYSPTNGDTRRMPMSALTQYLEDASIAQASGEVTLYTPTTGFVVAVPTPVKPQQWLLLQPAGTLASGALTLPSSLTTPDGTEVLLTTTQGITTFTVNLNGATAAFGAPTSLVANGLFALRFYQPTNSWYRIS